MINPYFKSKSEECYEETINTFKVKIHPPKDPKTAWKDESDGLLYDHYFVYDTRKSWRDNECVRIIKQHGTRINFANKKRMSHYDLDIVDYINQTYPLPQ